MQAEVNIPTTMTDPFKRLFRLLSKTMVEVFIEKVLVGYMSMPSFANCSKIEQIVWIMHV